MVKWPEFYGAGNILDKSVASEKINVVGSLRNTQLEVLIFFASSWICGLSPFHDNILPVYSRSPLRLFFRGEGTAVHELDNIVTSHV